MKICLWHILGNCPHCKMDDYNKHCPKYWEIGLLEMEVKSDNSLLQEKELPNIGQKGDTLLLSETQMPTPAIIVWQE